ncbi:hypothetical protein ACFOQM_03605 [Paenibacillus sp. GCM10012307]|uniref:Uncharacterized protein n=1 Tax=Paenibacillus roseus TaxID=2798579 RepID=A0A934MJX4_9BACL|nr:hypothetical protein [Paenibacillus roseus]MBJ6360400.1 hypothetical protein [Paenibacillus roseus]
MITYSIQTLAPSRTPETTLATEKTWYTPEEKLNVYLDIWQNKKTVVQYAQELGISVERIARWEQQAAAFIGKLLHGQEQLKEKQNQLQQQLAGTQSALDKKSAHLDWLKTTLAANTSRKERSHWVDYHCRDLPLNVQTDLLKLNRSSLYYKSAAVQKKQ